jgi:Lrp/AsnC family leucine-responsive transcriptional regulator
MAKGQEMREKILSTLMHDSRKSFRTIASELNISTTTVSRIVKELENEGIILGYTTFIDWNKFGYESTLCILISISRDADTNLVGKQIKQIGAVKQVFYTTGDTTFSAYATCKNTEEAAFLIEELRRIEGIEQVVGHTVLKIF